MKIQVLIAVFFGWMCACSAQVQGVYKFLDLPGSAYSASLSNMLLNTQDSSIQIALSNPSFLNKRLNRQAFLNYNKYVADIHASDVAYVFTHKKYGVFMPTLKVAHYGKIQETNEFGEFLRDVSASEFALGLATGNTFFQDFRYGVRLRLIYSNLIYNSSFGFSTDYYLNYSKDPSNWGLSLAVENLGAQLKKFEGSAGTSLPLNIRLSASKRLAHAPFKLHIQYDYLNNFQTRTRPFYDPTQSTSFLTTTVDTTITTAQHFLGHLTAGISFIPSRAFHVNFAYNHKRAQENSAQFASRFAGFSLGFRLKLRRLAISYALFGNASGLSSNFISLTFLSLQRKAKSTQKKREPKTN